MVDMVRHLWSTLCLCLVRCNCPPRKETAECWTRLWADSGCFKMNAGASH